MELRFWCGKQGGLKQETAQLILHLKAMLSGGVHSLVLYPQSLQERASDWLGSKEWKEFPGDEGYLTVFTSGTTDIPKPIKKHFPSYYGSKKEKLGSNYRWLLTYNPYRWAGISMITHALRTGAELVVPDSLDARDLLRELPSVSHISITPSLFRKLILADTDGLLYKCALKQITFGGEFATQSVLDLTNKYWPGARVTHVYASTEHGDICSVSDGLAGIPADKWKNGSFTEAGELVISGHPTGDIWALKNGRYYFQGRVQDVANVGGAKVYLSSVEEAALAIAGVMQARAYAVSSPLVGQLVAMDYVGEIAVEDLKGQLRKVLPKTAMPVKLNRVEALDLSEAGKLRRR